MIAVATVAAQAHVSTVLSRVVPSGHSKVVVKLLDVTYPPGAYSDPHTHACPVIGYVLEGVIRSQVHGGASRTYTPGQAFYEAANQLHRVSENASRTRPARFLAYFVCGNSR